MGSSSFPESEKLWHEYKVENKLEARDKLIVNYMSIVQQILSRVLASLPANVDRDELNSYGIMGLIDAVEKYNHTLGYKFETYAYPRIKGAIIDGLRALDWVPTSVRKKSKELQKAIGQLEQELGRSADEEEISEHLNISITELNKIVLEATPMTLMSIDPMVEQEGKENLINSLEDTDNKKPEEILEQMGLQEILADAIEKLPEKEKMVVALYYYEGFNLREISKVMNLSESRISQLHTKAVFRLRGRLGRIKNKLF
ncbi:RNA polymerase sigma factor for flagellar operon FliA [Desulfitispora alkaliphila]|uniref:sigma-70 family RNA polymerase sigma factor n=1 Tax=Desulfitispora alkaliphila TaxID=622674 RepID=UPI003D2305B0